MTGFTIDSITIFISWENLLNYDFNSLEKAINAQTFTRGKWKDWKKGFHKKMVIEFHENNGIYIKGSISNFWCGYSSILDYKQLPNAISKLGYELGLNLKKARLYRVDIALNIETDKPIKHYIHNLFTDMPHYKRLEQDDGVRFETKNKVFAIYNKTQELYDNRNLTIGKNILRFEFRIKKNVGLVLGIKEMTLEMLYEKSVFQKVVMKFKEQYYKIKKQSAFDTIEEAKTLTPSTFSMLLKRDCINHVLGGEKEAYRYIEQADKEGRFKNANDKSRCKKIITDLSKCEIIIKRHPLIEELDGKIEFECNKILN